MNSYCISDGVVCVNRKGSLVRLRGGDSRPTFFSELTLKISIISRSQLRVLNTDMLACFSFPGLLTRRGVVRHCHPIVVAEHLSCTLESGNPGCSGGLL